MCRVGRYVYISCFELYGEWGVAVSNHVPEGAPRDHNPSFDPAAQSHISESTFVCSVP